MLIIRIIITENTKKNQDIGEEAAETEESRRVDEATILEKESQRKRSLNTTQREERIGTILEEGRSPTAGKSLEREDKGSIEDTIIIDLAAVRGASHHRGQRLRRRMQAMWTLRWV